MHLILTGPTNAGKSTQASKIAEQFSSLYESIDVGAIVRERAKQNDEVGIIFQEAVRTGTSAPQKLVFEEMSKKIRHVIDTGKFCVMTFSRLSEEIAPLLAQMIKPADTLVISFDMIDESALLDRAKKRLKTGERNDDTSEIALKRIRDYYTNLDVRLALWRKFGYPIISIDAGISEEAVFVQIVAIVQKMHTK